MGIGIISFANVASIITLAAVAKLLADNLGVYKTVSNNVTGILNVNTKKFISP